YYQAARPESETCGLDWRDVWLPDRETVKSIKGEPILGTVTFRDTKTGVDRRLPLHPEAEAALREIMPERPTDPGEIEGWEALPVFCNADGRRWDRHSYRKPWVALMAAVTKDHPKLAGMVMRDLRTAANTAMREAGTGAAIAAKLLGHSEGMNERHYV